MKIKISYLLLLISLPVTAWAQAAYPPEVLAALNQTSNTRELKKALAYIYSTGDGLKIKSINFLIANMPIHSSYNYYWANAAGSRVPYNESDYPDFKTAIAAFEKVKAKNGKLHPVAYTYRDIDSISSGMLIEDVELAVKKLHGRKAETPAAHNDPGEDFFEYILPYRTSVEPIQDWRRLYAEKFAGLFNTQPADTLLLRIGQNIKSWFTNTYKIAARSEPLPRLGAMQLLSRKKGACEDIAGLAVFMARSQGYPATVDFIPAWATASGNHFLDYINVSSNTRHHYDAADGYVLDTLAREPAKVLRTTYSIQPQSIAAVLNDSTQIPEGFMRMKNYKDVTQEYWQTANISATLFRPKAAAPKAVFISVWNFSKWMPVWYAEPKNNVNATFTRMGKGAVYLPMYYVNHTLLPAAWPIVEDYHFTKILQPDLGNKRVVHIREQPKYLALRPGKKYTLFYWNNRWVPVDTVIPQAGAKDLAYGNVPANALLLLMPEYSRGKERPFIINETGETLWY